MLPSWENLSTLPYAIGVPRYGSAAASNPGPDCTPSWNNQRGFESLE